MNSLQWSFARTLGAIASMALILISTAAFAVQPTVKTVPWVASNPLIPHDAFSGVPHTLKGTADVQGTNFEYTWDFGETPAVPVATGDVLDQYSIAASHAYTGSPGTIFVAKLTVRDKTTNESDTENYYVQIRAVTLETEVNVAIDEGLWYLHKTMRRFDTSGLPAGDWLQGTSCGLTCASSGNYANTPSNLSAFLVNGHNEVGAASNPYTETAQRGVKGALALLNPVAILASQTNPVGTFNPDADGNGVGVRVNQGNEFYQGGMFMDAIVATATPNKPVPALPPFAGRTDGTGPGGAWTYFDVVQNMADYYAYCQYDSGTATTQPPGTPDAVSGGGGWRYSCNAFPDGSAVQWAAIGMIAAERNFGAVIHPNVKEWMRSWTDFAHNQSNGVSGYTSTGTVWGPHATTPSGTVQMVWNGYGRGTPMWDSSENFLRANFCNAGSASSAMRDYYYGLFSFTKSMLLHDTNADAVSEPITDLECRGTAPCALAALDWYEAQATAGDQCDGVARTLVGDQRADGAWYAHNFSSAQYPFETGWAIIMLNRTVFASGVPVAVADAVPNPAVVGQTINVDGSNSFHQDSALNIVQWEWDLDNDGQYDDATGVNASTSFGALGNYPVGLRVTDDAATPQTATTTVTIIVDTPPLAPTADANGPYAFCPQNQPWLLDGSGSVNPDEGGSELGQPGDTIQSYEWELDNDGQFDDASGAQPDVTAYFAGLGIGNYLVQLRVTDTTGTSYPNSNFGDLSDTDSAQVSVKDAGDAACGCVDDLTSRPKSGKIQLVWSDTGPAGGYNVYRSTTPGGPYTLIANTTSSYSTYLDTTVVNGTTYYYVVRVAALNGDELCESNETSATPMARRRR